ncbi:MAG: conjugal transfer protein TraW [Rickettsiaceae bacterium]|nr:conjugal transfer protein TraW [Rickettsiaceae bacterium]
MKISNIKTNITQSDHISIFRMLQLFFLMTLSLEASAADLGTFGHSFAIKEESFLDMIRRKLKNIDIAKHQDQMLLRANQKIQTPDPVENIGPAVKIREFSYDPTYILQKDIILPCGKLLYPKGTKVNPLDHMDFDRKLYFIDGREDTQIAWLKNELQTHHKAVSSNKNEAVQIRVILIAGSPLLLQEELDMQIFFDQAGELTNKFGIKASPAILEQDNKFLKITEVYIEEGA